MAMTLDDLTYSEAQTWLSACNAHLRALRTAEVPSGYYRGNGRSEEYETVLSLAEALHAKLHRYDGEPE